MHSGRTFSGTSRAARLAGVLMAQQLRLHFLNLIRLVRPLVPLLTQLGKRLRSAGPSGLLKTSFQESYMSLRSAATSHSATGRFVFRRSSPMKRPASAAARSRYALLNSSSTNGRARSSAHIGHRQSGLANHRGLCGGHPERKHTYNCATDPSCDSVTSATEIQADRDPAQFRIGSLGYAKAPAACCSVFLILGSGLGNFAVPPVGETQSVELSATNQGGQTLANRRDRSPRCFSDFHLPADRVKTNELGWTLSLSA